jgi:hypothetical protein
MTLVSNMSCLAPAPHPSAASWKARPNLLQQSEHISPAERIDLLSSNVTKFWRARHPNDQIRALILIQASDNERQTLDRFTGFSVLFSPFVSSGIN